MTDGALAGLRVIDAATLAAGPLIATWMGEQGAEVIKVEQPDGGDPLRQWGAQRDGIGLMWKSVARNKKCVTLNLRLEAGRDLLRSLARQADVTVDYGRPYVDRLVAENMVVRSNGTLELTEAGHEAAERLFAARREGLRELLADLSPEEYGELGALLTRLSRAMLGEDADSHLISR